MENIPRSLTILNIFLALVLMATSLTEYLSLVFIERGYTFSLLWYCHILAYTLAYSLVFRSSLLASAVLISAIPSQFMWIIDFIKMILYDGGSRTAWLFQPEITAWWIPYLSVLLHLIIIPIALYAVLIFGFHKKSFLPAAMLSVLVLTLTYFITTPTANINCVFFPCDLRWPIDQEIIQGNTFYFSIWYFLKEILFWLTTGLLTYIIIKKIFKITHLKIVD